MCWKYNNALRYRRSQRNYPRFLAKNRKSIVNLFWQNWLGIDIKLLNITEQT